MSVVFKELGGSPLEVFEPQAMRAQRRLLVAWEDRHALVARLLGEGYEFGGRGQAAYPGRPFIAVARIEVEPFPPSPDDQGTFDDVTSQLNSYSGKFALVTVDYELVDESRSRKDLPKVEDDTFLTYRMDFGAEYEDISGHVMYWASDGSIPVPPDAVPTIRVPITEHHITWHRVVNPPWQAMRECVGTVNAAAFLGAAAETVLLDGVTADKQFVGIDELSQPQFGWKIAYVFREKAVKAGGNIYGWNHRFRSLPPGGAGWDKLVDQAGNPLYRTSDLSALFRFAALA